MKTLLLITLLLSTAQAHALAPDKRGHMLAGFGIGISVSLATGKPKYGFWTGCAVGAAKEAYDATGRGTPEFADLAYTCVGAGVGSWAIGEVLR